MNASQRNHAEALKIIRAWRNPPEPMIPVKAEKNIWTERREQHEREAVAPLEEVLGGKHAP